MDAEVRRDNRGHFVKVFEEMPFAARGWPTHFAEEYWSYSIRRALRGLHFQIPPFEHWKLVYCVHGRVVDAVVDVRVGSPTYGHHVMFQLAADAGAAALLGPGLAHGFYVLSDSAVMIYKVTSGYSPGHDTGIRWDSAGIPWPDQDPVISSRDASLVELGQFRSPFKWQGA